MALRRLVAWMGLVSLLAALWLCVASSGEAAVGDPFFWQYPALWRFNGEDPSAYGYHIQSTLSLGQAEPQDGTAVWTITSGFDKAGIVDGDRLVSTVTRTGMGANIIAVRSKAPSAAPEDVTVHLTWNGNDQGSTTHTVRSPDHLHRIRNVDANYGNGYESDIHYYIHDQFSTTLGHTVPINEVWTTSLVSDYAGENWPWNAAGGATVNPADWYDQMIRANMTIPTCQNPQGGNTRVDHRGQRWCVGSTTSGRGTRVQDNVAQIYRDHGRHE